MITLPKLFNLDDKEVTESNNILAEICNMLTRHDEADFDVELNALLSAVCIVLTREYGELLTKGMCIGILAKFNNCAVEYVQKHISNNAKDLIKNYKV
jgi:hypothetical protein